MTPTQAAIKRGMDVLVSGILLVALSPILAIVALVIKLDSPGPVFFRQERGGLNGKPFTVWKFRTMVDHAVEMTGDYSVGEKDARITRVGSFLRDWALDEVPQLINVLKGEMSLVGPRPTLMYQIEQYDAFQKKRLRMRPGLTGLAQVTGRKSLSWEERIEHDVWYVEHHSLGLDLQILFRTFGVLLRQEGIYADQNREDGFGSGTIAGER
jgi:undecaprenyl phosphate N,N'-diacetylbacillosamine 1-phosphate transferase